MTLGFLFNNMASKEKLDRLDPACCTWFFDLGHSLAHLWKHSSRCWGVICFGQLHLTRDVWHQKYGNQNGEQCEWSLRLKFEDQIEEEWNDRSDQHLKTRIRKSGSDDFFSRSLTVSKYKPYRTDTTWSARMCGNQTEWHTFDLLIRSIVEVWIQIDSWLIWPTDWKNRMRLNFLSRTIFKHCTALQKGHCDLRVWFFLHRASNFSHSSRPAKLYTDDAFMYWRFPPPSQSRRSAHAFSIPKDTVWRKLQTNKVTVSYAPVGILSSSHAVSQIDGSSPCSNRDILAISSRWWSEIVSPVWSESVERSWQSFQPGGSSGCFRDCTWLSLWINHGKASN